MDVVQEDSVIPAGVLRGHELGDIVPLGIDLKDVLALEHATGKLGLAKAQGCTYKRQARVAPLRPDILVKLEGNHLYQGKPPP